MLCMDTMRRAPNLLVDEDDLIEFLSLLAKNVDALPETQLANVQSWAITSIGHDARGAYDWLVILRVLKRELINRLENQFPAAIALAAYRQMDDLLTYAVIEATQLASDMQRADMLEHMVQLRTKEVQLDESKNKFIAVAAHELKTPLTILEGYANILKAELYEQPRLRIYLDGLGNGFRRMHEIITDLVDVSLLDLQAVELSYEEVDLAALMEGIVKNVSPFYAERNVQLSTVMYDVPTRTFVDREKLTKALTKVVMNALKYTPDRGRVLISAAHVRQDESSEEMNGFVDIQVMDTGIGIARDNLEAIFNKFGSIADASLHSSSKTKFKGGGPGLGLPIAKGIIDAHGGRIWAESAGYDERRCPGSTFHIELPIWLHKPEWLL